MTLLLVYSARNSQAARAVLASGDEDIVIYECDDVFPWPDHPRVRRRLCIYDVLSVQDFEDIRDFSWWFQDRWFHIEGRDLTEYRGFSIGTAQSARDGLRAILPAIKDALVAHRLLADRPSRILLGDGSTLRAHGWQWLAARRDIPLERLAEDPAPAVEKQWSMFPDAAPATTSGVGRRSFRAGWEMLRFVAAVFIARLSRRPRILVAGGDGEGWVRECADFGLIPVLTDVGTVHPLYSSSFAVLRRLFARQSGRAKHEFDRRLEVISAVLADSPQFRFKEASFGEWLRPWIETLFRRDFPNLVVPAMALRVLIALYRPTVYVARNKHDFERRLLRHVADRCGVPSLLLVHGPRADYFCERIGPATWVLTDGPSTTDWALKEGHSSDRVIQCGHHTKDEAFKQRVHSADADAIRSKYGLGAGPVILYCDTAFGDSDFSNTPWRRLRNLRLVVAAARQFPSVCFVVKFHPPRPDLFADGPDAVQRCVDLIGASGVPNVIAVPQRSRIDELLAVAAGLVVENSTVIYEAVAVGVPVILLRNPALGIPALDFEQDGACYVVGAETELVTGLTGIFGDSQRLAATLGAGQRKLATYIYGPPRSIASQVEAILRAPRSRAGIMGSVTQAN